MLARDQSTTATDHAAKMVCSKCKSKEMRRRSRTVFDQVTSYYPYVCARCGNHKKQFRVSVSTVVRAIFLLVLLSGGTWFWMNPLSFRAASAQKDQTEALARARTAMGGELSTFEQMMLRKSRIAMNNTAVLKLVNAKVGKDVIVQMIRTSNADYDISADSIIGLKEAGVDEAIILCMIDANYAAH